MSNTLYNEAIADAKQLKQAREDERANADMPSVPSCFHFRQLFAGRLKRRSQYKEDDAEDAGRIDPQRHGRHVAAAGPFGQPKSQCEKHQVPQHHANRRAWDHVRDHELRRPAQLGQQANRQDQAGDIVQH